MYVFNKRTSVKIFLYMRRSKGFCARGETEKRRSINYRRSVWNGRRSEDNLLVVTSSTLSPDQDLGVTNPRYAPAPSSPSRWRAGHNGPIFQFDFSILRSLNLKICFRGVKPLLKCNFVLFCFLSVVIPNLVWVDVRSIPTLHRSQARHWV